MSTDSIEKSSGLLNGYHFNLKGLTYSNNLNNLPIEYDSIIE